MGGLCPFLQMENSGKYINKTYVSGVLLDKEEKCRSTQMMGSELEELACLISK